MEAGTSVSNILKTVLLNHLQNSHFVTAPDTVRLQAVTAGILKLVLIKMNQLHLQTGLGSDPVLLE